eukprot:gene49169-46100_t
MAYDPWFLRPAEGVHHALRLPFGEALRVYPKFAALLDALPGSCDRSRAHWGPSAPPHLVALLRKRALPE